MRLLSQKDGKFWWMECNPRLGQWLFISEEENTAYWKAERERFEKMVADIYNKAFNKENI